jgi:hypothetical protein
VTECIAKLTILKEKNLQMNEEFSDLREIDMKFE